MIDGVAQTSSDQRGSSGASCEVQVSRSQPAWHGRQPGPRPTLAGRFKTPPREAAFLSNLAGRISVAVSLALLLPAAAHAGAWADFETRCLSALENQVPPVVAGLGTGARDGDVVRYALTGGRTLAIETAPADGMRACVVRDPGGAPVPGFDTWIAAAVEAERYLPVAEGKWRSHLWIEPVLEVQKTIADGAITLRIVETYREA